MPPQPREKSKFDRVKETVTILKKLQEMGVHDENEGYLKAKEALDEWIKTGKADEHMIPIRSFRRNLILSLPAVASKEAVAILRAM
jgi:hypothetical protein